MASNTYVALATQTLTGSEGGVTFTSIPQGYTDLRIVYSGTGSTTIPFALRYNGDSGSNYSYTLLYGTGSSALSTRGASQSEAYNGNVWTDQNVITVDLMGYSNSTTYKTAISRANSAGNRVAAWVSMWRNTAAITEILITATGGGTYQAGSTFTLYGIAAASVGAKATGGTIYQDSSYFYHVFAGNGTFTPSQSLSCDVLMVAGGGGGGFAAGGGGGAGGLITSTGTSFSATGYSITVGAGAAAATSDGSSGGAGTNTTFNGWTALGGGGGGHGGPSSILPSSGGSGGGAGYKNGSNLTGASATQTSPSGATGYGYAGGNTTYTGSFNSGGGGGAGGLGGDATSSTPTIGGIGLTSSLVNAVGAATGVGQLSSGSWYIAGGGGGSYENANSTGGLGGGGAGGTVTVTNTSAKAGDGKIATGSGGGGGSATGAYTGGRGGAGGSGVVIVRYAK